MHALTLVRLHKIISNVTFLHFFSSLTLLCGIVLVGLTLPLPYIAINVIKIVGGSIGNAVELEEVGLCGQSPEQRHKPPRKHRGRGWSEAVTTRLHSASQFSSPIYLFPPGRLLAARSVRASPPLPT